LYRIVGIAKLIVLILDYSLSFSSYFLYPVQGYNCAFYWIITNYILSQYITQNKTVDYYIHIHTYLYDTVDI